MAGVSRAQRQVEMRNMGEIASMVALTQVKSCSLRNLWYALADTRRFIRKLGGWVEISGSIGGPRRTSDAPIRFQYAK